METVAFKRKPIFTFKNITLLILNIAVSTKNFTVEGLIEKAYKFTYKSILKDRNYLKSNSTENLLLIYILIPIRQKQKKKKLLPISSPLIVSKELKNLISSILLLYNNTSDSLEY